MSRRMVAPGVWVTEGGATPYVVSGYGGTLVQSVSSGGGQPGSQPPRDPRLERSLQDAYNVRRNLERKREQQRRWKAASRERLKARCGVLTYKQKLPCARPVEHPGYHKSAESLAKQHEMVDSWRERNAA